MKKSTWIILGLIVALGLIYFLTKEDHISVGVKRIKLPVFATDKADRIEINTKEAVTLRKVNDKWQLEIGGKEHPRLVRADQSNVAALLDAALAVRHSHYVTNLKEKYPELGLEGDDAVTIGIYEGDTTLWGLILGKNAKGAGRYAKIPDDNDAYVVRGSFWQLTRNGLNDWRDRDIMPVKEGEIASFKLSKLGTPFMSLTKNKDSDEWNFDETQKLPKEFRPDKVALANLVRSLLNMKASGFIDEPRDLGTALMTIDVLGADGKHEISFFAGPKDTYFAKRANDDQIYEISKFNFDKINKPIGEFRALNVLNFDKSKIAKLTLNHGKELVIVDKRDGAWRIEDPKKLPEKFEFDPVAVDDMLAMLSGLTAARIANQSKDRPQNDNWQRAWLIELITDSGEKIHLYSDKSKAKADEYLVRGNIDQEVYVVKNSRLESLHGGLNAFKKEEFELPPIDENVKGFESLPPDVQRKLLDAAKKKK